MPVYLEPNREFPVVLKSDEARSPKPIFWAKSLSMRMQADVAAALDKWFLADVDTDQLFKDTATVFLKIFTRLENMPGAELSEAWLIDHLTYQEARELLQLVLHNNHLDHDAKKG